MSREVHVRFCEGLGLQCPGLLTLDITQCHDRTVPKVFRRPLTLFPVEVSGYFRAKGVSPNEVDGRLDIPGNGDTSV